MAENKPEGQPKTQPNPASRHPDSVIWTRRNIILFIIVVAQGALILAGLIFVALLIFFPTLRQRVLPSEEGATITRPLTISPNPSPIRTLLGTSGQVPSRKGAKPQRSGRRWGFPTESRWGKGTCGDFFEGKNPLGNRSRGL